MVLRPQRLQLTSAGVYIVTVAAAAVLSDCNNLKFFLNELAFKM